MTERMNPDVKAKWLDALRSGDYKQARDDLRVGEGDGASFCCLGVLADLYRKEVGGTWVEGEISDTFRDVKGGYAHGSYLTEDIRRWAGAPVDEHRTFTGLPTWRNSLAELNDSSDFGFPEIANLIEEDF